MNYNKGSAICYTLIAEVDYHVYLQPWHRDEKRVVNSVTKIVSA